MPSSTAPRFFIVKPVRKLHQLLSYGESEGQMSSAEILSPKRSLAAGYVILWGGLIAGILDAVDGVIAFDTQGLNPIQVLQYIASGALGRSACCIRCSNRVRVCEPVGTGLEDTTLVIRVALRASTLLLHELHGIAAVRRCAEPIQSRFVSQRRGRTRTFCGPAYCSLRRTSRETIAA
jgi:hypothetical protein